MKVYKAFNPDMTCRGFQYEIGKTYEIEGEPIMCARGFHACMKLESVFYYYSNYNKPILCEVEILGDVVYGKNDEDKIVTNKIKIVRELTKEEVEQYAFDLFKLKGESRPLVYALLQYPDLGQFISGLILRRLPTYEQKQLVVHGSKTLRHRFLKEGNPMVKQELIQSAHLYSPTEQKIIFNTLIQDSNEDVRAEIAIYGKKTHRDILMNDSSPKVRTQVALFATNKQLNEMVMREENKSVLCAIYKKGTKKQKEIANNTLFRIYGYNLDTTERND